MKKLKDLGFKNLNGIKIIEPPHCEEHGDMILELPGEGNEQLEGAVELLHEYDKRGAALILMNKQRHKALYPITVFDKNEKECTVAVEFMDKEGLLEQGKVQEYKNDTIIKFNEMILKNNIKTILVLEQDEENQEDYHLIY